MRLVRAVEPCRQNGGCSVFHTMLRGEKDFIGKIGVLEKEDREHAGSNISKSAYGHPIDIDKSSLGGRNSAFKLNLRRRGDEACHDIQPTTHSEPQK